MPYRLLSVRLSQEKYCPDTITIVYVTSHVIAFPKEGLFNISGSMSEQVLVQQYTFSASDLTLVNRQREGHNRLGFAVQLAYLRFPGRPLQAGEEPPAPLLGYVAAQMRLLPLVFRRYTKRDTTRR